MSASGLTTMFLEPAVTRRVRAFFAPVDRAQGIPVVFDPARNGGFDLNNPPAPWMDLGWIEQFVRKSGSQTAVLSAGAPAVPQLQYREQVAATVSFRFPTWNKLTMALSAGSQHMNLLATGATAAANGSGGKALPAVTLTGGSTAITLNMSETDAVTFSPGQIIAVDHDYAGQTGYVGTPVSAAYIRKAGDVNNDPDYVRRVTFNLARVAQVTQTGVALAAPLPAGAPDSTMKMQAVVGFVDREGGKFFQEWSALFVQAGEQGERILFHYPRLQATAGAQESSEPLAVVLERQTLNATFRALPVTDSNDGEQVLCFRSFIPSPMMGN